MKVTGLLDTGISRGVSRGQDDEGPNGAVPLKSAEAVESLWYKVPEKPTKKTLHGI